ncbi:hypothetical protein [Pseudonocardia asaccharolytica]|uniref:Uncharacterized protein n=1 Tax=Pseudonocardia asaccharolytica DSM 44247 = NBRC 16224 TaxID=1123024 RepID=A0A511D433_9PSEU|nr:hypothetical protein [Pseudonocardia asaccharolytica]GEL17658.1 hypothetical protein PA7_14950 [Pseudonocardia asaccharolytica DSM 44247 = NBRC 16224]
MSTRMTVNEPGTTAVDSLATWVQAYREACTNRDQWGEIADRAKQQITTHLEQTGAEIGTINGHPAVKWTEVVSRRLNTKALREKDPEIADRYTIETVSRRFALLTPTDTGEQ